MAGKVKEVEVKYLLYEDGVEYTTAEFRKIYQSIKSLEFDIFKSGAIINQGYLPLHTGIDIAKILGMDVYFNPTVARLRSKSYFDTNIDRQFYFTLKGDGDVERDELEKLIERELYLNHWRETQGKRIKKVRYERPYGKYKVEFDDFIDDRPDLILAEIEVPDKSHIAKLIPLGKDVTYDPKYKNINLAK